MDSGCTGLDSSTVLNEASADYSLYNVATLVVRGRKVHLSVILDRIDITITHSKSFVSSKSNCYHFQWLCKTDR